MNKIINKLIEKLDVNQQINDRKVLFEYFFGGKILFFIVFIMSIEYIWLTEKNKKVKYFFTIYEVFLLLIIWNPVCIKILEKFINFGSMYRFYFMLPFTLTIAYAITKIISKLKNKYYKLGAIFGVFIVISYIQGSVFNESNTIKVNNWYKLPDETIAVAEIIENDDMYEEKRAMVPYGMSSQIQQVYADIFLPYTRIVFNIPDENGNPSPTDSDHASEFPPVVNLNNGNVEYLGQYAKDNNLNYIVVSKEVILNDDMKNIGFELFRETNENVVYRKMNSK